MSSPLSQFLSLDWLAGALGFGFSLSLIDIEFLGFELEFYGLTVLRDKIDEIIDNFGGTGLDVAMSGPLLLWPRTDGGW